MGTFRGAFCRFFPVEIWHAGPTRATAAVGVGGKGVRAGTGPADGRYPISIAAVRTYLGSGLLVPETGRAQMDGGGWSRPVPALVGCRLPGFPSV